MNLFFLSVIVLAHAAMGFAPRSLHLPAIHSIKQSIKHQHRTHQVFMSSTETNSQEKLTSFITSIQRPRGVSVGIEYTSSSADVSILSMQLRKLNARAIYTSSIEALQKFAKEQSSAAGDFPGPVPVVYNGDSWRDAVDSGADMIVLDYASFNNQDDLASLKGVGVIWKVSQITHIQDAIVNDMGNVFLLSDDFLFGEQNESNGSIINMEQLQEQLSTVPESAILVAQLQSMLPENAELTLGKSLSSTNRVTSLLFKNCCVNDEEDIKLDIGAKTLRGKALISA
jgi:hypothetical protein